MSEWHLPPDYIVNNWTDELLDLMVEKLIERKEREAHPNRNAGDGKVPDTVLFARAKKLIKVVKKHGD